MQIGIVSEGSLLLTRYGWINCSHAAVEDEITVAGVDRHGRVSEVKVALRPSDISSTPVFLGTSKCCGIFSPSTTIQDAAGCVWTLEHIVQNMSVGEMRFETLLCVDRMLSTQQQIDFLWKILCSESAFSDDTSIVIRCRGMLKEPTSSSDLGCFIKRKERVYFQMTKNELKQIVKDRRERELMGVIAQVFLNEDGLSEFGRDGAYIAMAIGGSITADQKTFELSYDSLQHTSAIYLRTSVEETQSLVRGRCVHVIGESRADWQISWSAQSWNPICNGIVIIGTGTP